MKRRILMSLAVIALLLSVYIVYVNSKSVLYVGKVNTALVNHRGIQTGDKTFYLRLLLLEVKSWCLNI